MSALVFVIALVIGFIAADWIGTALDDAVRVGWSRPLGLRVLAALMICVTVIVFIHQVLLVEVSFR